jgi:serine/threonine protein kinase
MIDRFTLRELEDAFQRAVALPPADRGLFLDRECRLTLRAHVERLIDADSRANEIFNPTHSGDAAVADGRTSIGRWRLIERIGSGGLGVVYRASCECDGVTLQAAVKILRPGLSALLHTRFVQERSILAGLDHPYIARLIDVGADECGTSFLAMEFVEGLPLDLYLEQRHPAFSERLELFAKICDAAAFLHEHAIVHGDLKPSNVMVRADGTPKLLDFGTAQLVNGGRDTSEAFARSMMTPAYASPEQIAGLGPSARGDVYSLGCVLKEILGSRTLCGDLVAIRDKCLASSPERRYESPRQLAADLDRYRRRLPIGARPRSASYVAAKFIRRNRTVCAVASLAVASLIAGALVSRHNATRAQRYADQYRSVVTRLVRDEPAPGTPDAEQRAAFAAGVADVIAQMERMQPPPLADLAIAWRRVSYAQAARGQTPESIASIERSIHWARRYAETSVTPDAMSQLAESLLHAATLQRRRSNPAEASRLASEAVEIVDTLPQSRRRVLERTPQFVRALLPVARLRARSGDVAGGRALLLRGIDLGRRMGKTEELRTTLNRVWFERAVGATAQAVAACADAKSIGITTERLETLCGASRTSARRGGEANAGQQSDRLERQLLQDPERYDDRLQLARRKLQLARFAIDKGDTVRARDQVEQARVLAEGLLREDPESRPLQQLVERIARVNTRIATD